jgi:hypothetical protein
MAVASHPVKKRFYDPNPSGLNSQNLPMNMDLRIVG